ncbi:ethanolamine ammonia-lyase subunit EutC [Trinickia diaoshuihuensis]|uniref:ethanolamine ammonia-lyase subunit EutC n=1 Tax=Trinickia diaoshuihuensis TaxID=2292265 RepID=UPI000E271C85|nr:ethanolamine ammonia-lyase subunit EutC [Trinickia diaoshuihuensis]
MTRFVAPDPWHALRGFTRARIALGRTGHGLPTDALLAFELSHAKARDAVHQPFEIEPLRAALNAEGLATLDAHSAAADRAQYLRRPDLGRRLSRESRAALEQARADAPELTFVVADGLSAFAVAHHALPVLVAARAKLSGWRIGPVVLARQARVALGDEIGEVLGAAIVAVLIGERPGLSSPDSLGIYLTYGPRVGRTDAERNCISNVRPEGLGYEHAAHKLHYLLTQAKRLSLTGVALKDESDVLDAPGVALASERP